MAKEESKNLEEQLNEVENKIHLLTISGKDIDVKEELEEKRLKLIKALGRKP